MVRGDTNQGSGEGSDFRRVTIDGQNSVGDALTLSNIKAPKNGYVYVYVSNESEEPVYFDNLKISHNRGRIIEEDHYYAFGMKIAAISSTKLADANERLIDNKNLYNDKELDDEGDVDWYDYGFRNYNAQIGRFVEIDPLTDVLPALSPYHYAFNDPVSNIDKDGLIACPGTSSVALFFGKVGDAISKAADVVKSGLMAASTVTSFINIGIQTLKAGDDIGNYITDWSDVNKLRLEQLNNSDPPNGPPYIYGFAYFESPEAAAISWGKQFNPSSISKQKELFSWIFKVKINGKYYYSYTDPIEGNDKNVDYDKIEENKKNIPTGGTPQSMIHAHGNYNGVDNDVENFSPSDGQGNGDYGVQGRYNLDFYLTTPSGNLKVIRENGPSQGNPQTIYSGLPSDSNSPIQSGAPKVYYDKWQDPEFDYGNPYYTPHINKSLTPILFYIKMPDSHKN